MPGRLVDRGQVMRLLELEPGPGRIADHDDPPVDPEDVDVGAVQLRHPLGREYLVGGPDGPPAVDHEEDAIDEMEDRIDVVGHEQDRAAGTPLGTTAWDVAAYLKEKAHHCMRLARSCPDRETSHALEAMGLEFLDRATELERMLTIPPAEAGDKGSDA